MGKGKLKNLNIRIEEEYLGRIKQKAKEEEVSMALLVVAKTLDLEIKEVTEIKDYFVTAKGKKYPQQRIVKKKILEEQKGKVDDKER